MSLIEIKQGTGLDQTEIAGIFELVIGAPLPAAADRVEQEVATLLTAADLLKAYGVATMPALTILKRLWLALQDPDPGDHPALLHIINRRYVGWPTSSRARTVLDATTGGEAPDRPDDPIIESTVYDLPQLLRYRIEIARGERDSLWGGKDAADRTPCPAAGPGGGGLGRPEVVRDDARDALPR